MDEIEKEAINVNFSADETSAAVAAAPAGEKFEVQGMEFIAHVITQEDLDVNPAFAGVVSVGDKIGIPAEIWPEWNKVQEDIAPAGPDEVEPAAETTV
jgi:hypothetical protein